MRSRDVTQRPTPGLRDRLLVVVVPLLGATPVGAFPVDEQLSDLGMTSVKMVELMLAIDIEFDVAIPPADITPENFHSLATVESMLARLTAYERAA
jgi:acyl carrier protein